MNHILRRIDLILTKDLYKLKTFTVKCINNGKGWKGDAERPELPAYAIFALSLPLTNMGQLKVLWRRGVIL